jgi:hypothetical protein
MSCGQFVLDSEALPDSAYDGYQLVVRSRIDRALDAGRRHKAIGIRRNSILSQARTRRRLADGAEDEVGRIPAATFEVTAPEVAVCLMFRSRAR